MNCIKIYTNKERSHKRKTRKKFDPMKKISALQSLKKGSKTQLLKQYERNKAVNEVFKMIHFFLGNLMY